MKRLLAIFLLVGICTAQAETRWKKRWILANVALVAASLLDVQSSRGKFEANPLMRTSDGRFNLGRGLAIKGISFAGLFATQRALGKANEDLYRPMTFVTLGTAGALSAVAIHNAGVR